jgi:hypothetical protein
MYEKAEPGLRRKLPQLFVHIPDLAEIPTRQENTTGRAQIQEFSCRQSTVLSRAPVDANICIPHTHDIRFVLCTRITELFTHSQKGSVLAFSGEGVGWAFGCEEYRDEARFAAVRSFRFRVNESRMRTPITDTTTRREFKRKLDVDESDNRWNVSSSYRIDYIGYEEISCTSIPSCNSSDLTSFTSVPTADRHSNVNSVRHFLGPSWAHHPSRLRSGLRGRSPHPPSSATLGESADDQDSARLCSSSSSLPRLEARIRITPFFGSAARPTPTVIVTATN